MTRNAGQRSFETSQREAGDEGPARAREAGSCDLATKDRQLLAQYQDLGVLGDAVHVGGRQGLDDATDQAMEEAERHRSPGSLFGFWLVKPAIALLDPSGNVLASLTRFIPEIPQICVIFAFYVG